MPRAASRDDPSVGVVGGPEAAQQEIVELELVQRWRGLSPAEGQRLQCLRSARSDHFRRLLARSN
ncbi:MAG: hypothetical protein MI919_20005, partial [Holophagales bacterium]|nr:hypothetical protein [Holophagales bacterium]